jgi:hypothetical protein
VWTDSTSSWTGGAFGPPWARGHSAAGALTVRRYGAPKLTAVARGGRGRRRGAHRGHIRAARLRGCAGGGEDRGSAVVLGVEKRNKERHELWCGAVM